MENCGTRLLKAVNKKQEVIMAVHIIENEELKVQVLDHGGELVSIIKKRPGKNISGMRTLPGGTGIPRYFSRLWAG